MPLYFFKSQQKWLSFWENKRQIKEAYENEKNKGENQSSSSRRDLTQSSSDSVSNTNEAHVNNIKKTNRENEWSSQQCSRLV